jgi:iron(III) transport system ATP-binding protein
LLDKYRLKSMNQSIILRLENLCKQFGTSSISALNDVNLSLERGDLLGLLGPSGCGKTTLLRIIAGFEKPSQGTVEIGGKLVNSNVFCCPPEQRNTGMVFQDYALFPHLTVAENVAFGLRNKKDRSFSNKQIKEKVSEILGLVSLGGLEKRYPHELSGGQQQRVALARALAPEPALILLDEPLSNLDLQVRIRLREEIRHILKAAGTSAIFVTHDREEALAISDKIGVMRQGRLEQLGTPEDIYTKPRSRFVAEFVTQANFLPAYRKGNFWKTEIGELEIKNSAIADACDDGELMLRQEDLTLNPDDRATVVVKERQFLGREYRYCLETASGKRLHALTNANTPVAVGTKVNLSFPSFAVKIFPVPSAIAR